MKTSKFNIIPVCHIFLLFLIFCINIESTVVWNMKIFYFLFPDNSTKKNYFPKSKSSFLLLSFILFFCLSISFYFRGPFLLTSSSGIKPKNTSSHIVIIDAGHGGADPGKIGINGTLEKDINLTISYYLKEILESQDITVLLTREKDNDLATDSSNFKSSDMKNRISFIQESKADLVISIHQNSFTSPLIHGAQCFYYTPSNDGKALASCLQQQIISCTDQTKIRDIKGLKKSAAPGGPVFVITWKYVFVRLYLPYDGK